MIDKTVVRKRIAKLVYREIGRGAFRGPKHCSMCYRAWTVADEFLTILLTPTPDDTTRAREIAAQIFGTSVEHITLAPKYCGDGVDGDCARGDCHIVAAVPIIAAAFAAIRTVALTQRSELGKLLGSFI